MLRPAFRAVQLRFGRHDGVFRFAGHGRPVVIAGPNGSGKSTLVEGMIRTLFGFERRRGAETARLEARRPWSGGEMSGEVTLDVRGERVRIRRDFSSDRVRVDSPTEGIVHFDGDGNPGATNQEARHYRRILTDLFGLADLDAYQRTLFVRQGDLPATAVGDHLLRLAAGGHARVEGARRDMAEAHRAITRRPIQPGARAAINARELEKIEEEIAAVRARLADAEQAGERRGPIALERDRVADRLRALDEEIRHLEEARSALSRGHALELEARQLRENTRKLDRLAARLNRAADRVGAAEAAHREAFEGGAYPVDFPQRMAAADLRWRDLEALDGGVIRWPAIAAVVAFAAAVALGALDLLLWAAAAAALGLLALVAWLALLLEARRRRRAARAEIHRLADGVPGGEDLSPDTRPRHLARFHGQRAAAARRAAARTELAAAVREARAVLRDLRGSGLDGVEPAWTPPGRDCSQPGRAPTRLPIAARARRLEARAREGAAAARDRIARNRLDLDRLGDASLGLPDGIPPTENDVAAALAARRGERARLQRDVQELGQELLERGTPADSVAALEAALDELLPRRDQLDRKARAIEAAHALVADAYDAFRARDQDRLLAAVSHHAARLSAGRSGPVEVAGSLDGVSVRMGARVLPLESPPLSFGELHALLLAVRLGAADFLAGVGILPPLIIDEPFAHLDRGRARAAWELLRAIAAERQVIITTQDELLMDDLGITPDLRFPAE